MVYLCIYQLIPYERVCETFLDLFGHSISKATLVKAVSDCHKNLAGVEDTIRELRAGAQVLNVDETGMRVNGIRQWLHVASTELLTCFSDVGRPRPSVATVFQISRAERVHQYGLHVSQINKMGF